MCPFSSLHVILGFSLFFVSSPVIVVPFVEMTIGVLNSIWLFFEMVMSEISSLRFSIESKNSSSVEIVNEFLPFSI